MDNTPGLPGRYENAFMPLPLPLPHALSGKPFTIRQAKAAGLTRRRARAQDLQTPCHGVRIPGETGITLLVRAQALALATGAVVSHSTAAVLWGFPLPPRLGLSGGAGFQTGGHPTGKADIHVTCQPGERSVRRKNTVGHQSVLKPDEITTGRHLPCTSPLRTWFDLAGLLSLDEMVIAGDFLFRRKNALSAPAALDNYLATKAGRPGYRKAIQARALMRANTDSPKETELRLLLIRAGLPEPAINRPLFDEAGGWVQDPDMSYEELKIAIQYDGGHHATPAQRRSDIFRDENARELGWLVVVLTQWDLDPFAPGMAPRAVTRVRAALTSRGWKPAT